MSIFLRALVIAAAVLLSGGYGHADPLNIRIGYSNAPMHLTPILFERKDLLKHYGKSYTVATRSFKGGSPQVAALAANELDITAVSFQNLPPIINKAKLDVRVIADVIQSSVPGYADMLFIAKKGRFKSPKDLKGAVIAINAIGGGLDASVREYLSRFGLHAGTDYTIVEVQFGAMLVALESGRIDVAPLAPPMSIQAEDKGTYEPIFRYGDMVGPNQASMWIAQKSWLDAHHAALVDFFEDFLIMRRWLLDPANHDQAVKMVANVTHRPAAAYQSWLLTKRDWYRDPNGMPNVAMIQRNIDNSLQRKELDKGLNVKDYVDLSFLEEARKRLGK